MTQSPEIDNPSGATFITIISVQDDSSKCVTLLIHMCETTHSYM